MKLLYAFCIILCSSILLKAQGGRPDEQIQIYLAKSFHSAGDLNGLYFGTDYTRFGKSRLFAGITMAGTIHDGEIKFGPYIFVDNPGIETVKAIRMTTAGFQLVPFMGLSILKKNNHNLYTKIGLVGRFQSSQNYSSFGINIFNGSNTEYILSTDVDEKQREYLIGYSVALGYTFSVTNNYFFGGQLGIQNDIAGNVISGFGITLGRSIR